MQTYLQQALIFILAAVVAVPIFKYLGLGSVLGYLIAGVLIGPHSFGLVQDGESVMHFAELGVVFLLFVIGLEIEPRKLWGMRKHLLGLGGLQILTCTIIFGLVIRALLAKDGINYDIAFILGFTMSLSSTAFALQTLIEKNQLNTEFGRGSFSVLLMQDLVAIPALAIIPILISSTSANPSIVRTEYVIGALVALVLASRFLIRPAFRLVAQTHSRDIFTALALFIVMGVAALMQSLGLSAALGAFIAGVLLADSEYRHELETNIEPFKGLLMGLFFIAVGMSVQLSLLIQEPFAILALAFCYVLIKTAVVYFIGRLFRMHKLNAKLMGMNISQGGEFAFVIFGLIASLNSQYDSIIPYLTLVVSISMALTPILIFMHEFWQDKIRHRKTDFDIIPDESPDVLIAGFGRFGQIFGRILRAQSIPFTAIDHDPLQIELLRKFGTKVYYGDASRIDLLEAAGAKTAKFFILAIDDVQKSIETAKAVKENFPHLKILARARNRGHAFDLMEIGIELIKREIIDSSVHFVGQLLKQMGQEPMKVDRLVERFKEHDEIMMKTQFTHRKDDAQLVSVSKQGTQQLAQVLNDDLKQSNISYPNGSREKPLG